MKFDALEKVYVLARATGIDFSLYYNNEIETWYFAPSGDGDREDWICNDHSFGVAAACAIEKLTKLAGTYPLSRLVSRLGNKKTTYMGWSLAWFELCEYYDADGVLDMDGRLALPDHSGYLVAFRMRDEHREKAGWNPGRKGNDGKHA